MLWKFPKKDDCSAVTLANNMTADHNRIKINVGGTNFVTYWKTLRTIPNSRLASLSISGDNYDPEENEFFFDHNPQIFSCVLDFHRTGKLHFDHNLCVPKVKDELEFWSINENYLEPCCWNRYAEYDDQNMRLAEVNSVFDDSGPEVVQCKTDITTIDKNCDRLLYIKDRLWHFLDNPNSSFAAKVWAITFFMLLLISIFVLCAETHSAFRVQRQSLDNATEVYSNNKRKIMYTTDLHPFLELVEMGTNFIFTIELILRILTCPDKKMFWKTGMNWLDLMSVLSVWAMETLNQVTLHIFNMRNDALSFLAIFAMFRIIRIFRIFKLAKQYTGLKLLYLALRASTKELGLLCVFIVIGMIVFSTLIYYAEFEHESQFTDIPVGFWWSIVTMTTVGYGDLCPNTWSGYFVGAACAVVGMLATGLPIPIIANNFSRYYLYANIRARLQQRLSNQELCKKKSLISEAQETDDATGHCSKAAETDKISVENDFYSILPATKTNGMASIDDL